MFGGTAPPRQSGVVKERALSVACCYPQVRPEVWGLVSDVPRKEVVRVHAGVRVMRFRVMCLRVLG